MSKQSACVLVLWATGFEAAMATIFATEFRRQGLGVKVIGLSQRRAVGAHGLALVPDLTLEHVHRLKAKTTHVIVPCSSASCHRLKEDPRLSEFFALDTIRPAKFILGPMSGTALSVFPPQIDKIMINDTDEDLIVVARRLAQSLCIVT